MTKKIILALAMVLAVIVSITSLAVAFIPYLEKEEELEQDVVTLEPEDEESDIDESNTTLPDDSGDESGSETESDTTDTGDDTTDTGAAEETVSFTWDDASCTVAKGTTFGEFIAAHTNENGGFTLEGAYYPYAVVDNCIVYSESSTDYTNMCIPADGVIQDGQAYGYLSECTCTFEGIETASFTYYNGATWALFLRYSDDYSELITNIGLEFYTYCDVYCLNCHAGGTPVRDGDGNLVLEDDLMHPIAYQVN